MNPPSILLVDDALYDLSWVEREAEAHGYQVVLVTDAEAGKTRVDAMLAGEERYALAVIDLNLKLAGIFQLERGDHTFDNPERGGLDLILYIREHKLNQKQLPVLAIATPKSSELVQEVLATGSEFKLRTDARETLRQMLERRTAAP